MKLYLSSYRIPTPQDLYDLVNTKPSEIKVAIIPNAKDYYSKLAWDFKVNEFMKFITNLGMEPEVIDLKQYSDSQELKKRLSQYDIIWAIGGNTFCLRYEMHRSGFDIIIRDLLDRGIVYGGESAGAIVAGKNLHGVEYADEPHFAPKVITEGLSLVPFVILPHANSKDFIAITLKIKEMHKQSGTDFIELKDNQAIVVNGKDIRVVGA